MTKEQGEALQIWCIKTIAKHNLDDLASGLKHAIQRVDESIEKEKARARII